MDSRAIGVFDSGYGGLTAFRALAQRMPNEHLIYFGDTARVPYGTRSREVIISYARQDVKFLQGFDLKAILIACGTVSTTAMEALKAEFQIPLFGVVEPSAATAVAASRTGKIGLIGTPATVRSGAFEREILARNPRAVISSAACPLFVPLVENGRFHPDDVVVKTIVAEYLQPVKEAQVDTLVLGCTHYPHLMTAIGDFMGAEVALINSGAACAEALNTYLARHGALTDRAAPAAHQFYCSDSPADFTRLGSIFLETDITGEVSLVTLGES